jgi:phage shock protein A
MHDPIKELAARIEMRVAHLKRLRQTGHGLIARARKAVRKANTIQARARKLRARMRTLTSPRRDGSGQTA